MRYGWIRAVALFGSLVFLSFAQTTTGTAQVSPPDSSTTPATSSSQHERGGSVWSPVGTSSSTTGNQEGDDASSALGSSFGWLGLGVGRDTDSDLTFLGLSLGGVSDDGWGLDGLFQTSSASAGDTQVQIDDYHVLGLIRIMDTAAKKAHVAPGVGLNVVCAGLPDEDKSCNAEAGLGLVSHLKLGSNVGVGGRTLFTLGDANRFVFSLTVAFM